MYELFKARAEAVSAEVHRFPDRAAALAFIEEFIGGAPALWAEPGMTREAAASAQFGISRMDCAIADTGTLVQDATAIEQRLVSSLPPVHIALVPTGAIVPDMRSALARFDLGRCGYLAAITGPSRTADIERVLTIGVHGPKRLVIVFVDELEG
jgi:L-lactate dehydrogenase complex protein LldG